MYDATVETAADGTRGYTFGEFTGGHLLHLAVAGCVYNDLFREAAKLGVALTRASVSAGGGFAGDPCASTGVEYTVRVEGDAPRADLEALVAHVERIAEIPSALRLGADVRLTSVEVVAAGA